MNIKKNYRKINYSDYSSSLSDNSSSNELLKEFINLKKIKEKKSDFGNKDGEINLNLKENIFDANISCIKEEINPIQIFSSVKRPNFT